MNGVVWTIAVVLLVRLFVPVSLALDVYVLISTTYKKNTDQASTLLIKTNIVLLRVLLDIELAPSRSVQRIFTGCCPLPWKECQSTFSPIQWYGYMVVGSRYFFAFPFWLT